MTLALVSARKLPIPDPDEPRLLGALAARGVDARVVAWDDPAVEWGAFDACVIRSTWNYFERADEFVAWAERTARVSRLWNPAPVVRWNAHKAYLLELEAEGIAIAPTALVRRGTRARLADIAGERGWDEVVVKPAVSAGSFRTERFARERFAAGEEHFATVVAAGDALVQRYLPSVEGYGERALVWVGGELTHAVRKRARFGSDPIDWFQRDPWTPAEIAADEREFAARVLLAAPGPLQYARVDVARDLEGAPRLMELEVIEPYLFLGECAAAVERLAEAIAEED